MNSLKQKKRQKASSISKSRSPARNMGADVQDEKEKLLRRDKWWRLFKDFYYGPSYQDTRTKMVTVGTPEKVMQADIVWREGIHLSDCDMLSEEQCNVLVKRLVSVLVDVDNHPLGQLVSKFANMFQAAYNSFLDPPEIVTGEATPPRRTSVVSASGTLPSSSGGRSIQQSSATSPLHTVASTASVTSTISLASEASSNCATSHDHEEMSHSTTNKSIMFSPSRSNPLHSRSASSLSFFNGNKFTSPNARMGAKSMSMSMAVSLLETSVNDVKTFLTRLERLVVRIFPELSPRPGREVVEIACREALFPQVFDTLFALYKRKNFYRDAEFAAKVHALRNVTTQDLGVSPKFALSLAFVPIDKRPTPQKKKKKTHLPNPEKENHMVATVDGRGVSQTNGSNGAPQPSTKEGTADSSVSALDQPGSPLVSDAPNGSVHDSMEGSTNEEASPAVPQTTGSNPAASRLGQSGTSSPLNGSGPTGLPPPKSTSTPVFEQRFGALSSRFHPRMRHRTSANGGKNVTPPASLQFSRSMQSEHIGHSSSPPQSMSASSLHANPLDHHVSDSYSPGGTQIRFSQSLSRYNTYSFAAKKINTLHSNSPRHVGSNNGQRGGSSGPPVSSSSQSPNNSSDHLNVTQSHTLDQNHNHNQHSSSLQQKQPSPLNHLYPPHSGSPSLGHHLSTDSPPMDPLMFKHQLSSSPRAAIITESLLNSVRERERERSGRSTISVRSPRLRVNQKRVDSPIVSRRSKSDTHSSEETLRPHSWQEASMSAIASTDDRVGIDTNSKSGAQRVPLSLDISSPTDRIASPKPTASSTPKVDDTQQAKSGDNKPRTPVESKGSAWEPTTIPSGPEDTKDETAPKAVMTPRSSLTEQIRIQQQGNAVNGTSALPASPSAASQTSLLSYESSASSEEEFVPFGNAIDIFVGINTSSTPSAKVDCITNASTGTFS